MSDELLKRLNLDALVAYNDGRSGEAIDLWRQSLGLDPRQPDIQSYIAAALAASDEVEAAIKHYEASLQQHPDQPDIYYNLGNLQLGLGNLDKAGACYQNALARKPEFALAAYNLGNVCREQGHLSEAADCYRHAVKCDPSHAAAHNNLGNVLKHTGALADAVACYERALAINPNYREALYNLGNAFYEWEKFGQAIPWFDRADTRDAAARALYCSYRCRDYDEFRRRLDDISATGPHGSPLVATLAAHHAVNFAGENTYRFCPQPFDLVWQSRLDALTGPDAPLRDALLNDIRHAGIEERHQGRLHNGVQSAGNLFYRREDSFRELAELVRQRLREYRERFAGSDCELIRRFPKDIEFESSWYIRMRQGGHLTAHIHETGWISGAVYLALPPAGNDHAGAFEVSLHGDNYPLETNADRFPSRVLDLAVGDIVLFPANLFHRTRPFAQDTERVCIAFDLKPANQG